MAETRVKGRLSDGPGPAGTTAPAPSLTGVTQTVTGRGDPGRNAEGYSLAVSARHRDAVVAGLRHTCADADPAESGSEDRTLHGRQRNVAICASNVFPAFPARRRITYDQSHHWPHWIKEPWRL